MTDNYAGDNVAFFALLMYLTCQVTGEIHPTGFSKYPCWKIISPMKINSFPMRY